MDIFGIVIISILGVAFVIAMYYYAMVRIRGLETDGVVSRIEEHESADSDGHFSVTHEYYVRYTTQDGRSIESVLSNPTSLSDLLKPGSGLSVGSRVRIKYLPGNEAFVVMIKK